MSPQPIKVKVTEPNGAETSYPSINAVCKHLNIQFYQLVRWCERSGPVTNGRRTKWTFEYVETETLSGEQS